MRAKLTISAVAACMLSLTAAAQTPTMTSRGSAPSRASANAPSPVRNEDRDPLLDLPELPHNRVTLIGGTISELDEIMNTMEVQPFGTKHPMKVAFDTRTHFFEDGKPVSYRDIHQGQRIYFDSMLDGSTVFAKSIWIKNSTESGTGRGQIVDYDPQHDTLTVRDELSNQPIALRLTRSTIVLRAKQHASSSELIPGTLVSMEFGPQRDLRQITILAKPGSTFTFAGPITYLDVSRKLIAVNNRTDQNKYDISIDAIAPSIIRQLHQGDVVNVSAVFDGNRYAARSIDVQSANP